MSRDIFLFIELVHAGSGVHPAFSSVSKAVMGVKWSVVVDGLKWSVVVYGLKWSVVVYGCKVVGRGVWG